MDINPNAFIPDLMLPKSEAPKITPLTDATSTDGSGAAGAAAGTSFKDTLMGYLEGVNERINTSDSNIKDLAEGKTNDLNKVVTSVEEANLALQYTIAIRSKLLDAYQEVSRITV